ncbi:hypothetical protein [Paracoccus benzoatiresistens]|uniref:Tetracyclin repressor-like C-terminal domain-containing protein n=1 Tax=Paracoccus benzoatiresistens TaxID=2997341 RepID=A0ABT4JC95_9RHOB|nr:hypothetical protein [Paracoccus sp. EF6]MCZ0963968.1 hypothetical protein [Paracoccus sp. EF6]
MDSFVLCGHHAACAGWGPANCPKGQIAARARFRQNALVSRAALCAFSDFLPLGWSFQHPLVLPAPAWDSPCAPVPPFGAAFSLGPIDISMNTALQPGEHLLSAAIALATRMAAENGKPPCLVEVAKGLAISPESLETFIPDQTHLLNAMAESALEVLLHRVTHGVVAVSCRCPIGQFEALADAYIEWAGCHPYAFRVISAMSAGQLEAHAHMLRCRQSLHDLMHRILQRMKNEGLLGPDDDPNLLIAMSHTYAQGVISKMLNGDLARWAPGLGDQEAARALLRLFIDRCFRQMPLSVTGSRPVESAKIILPDPAPGSVYFRPWSQTDAARTDVG